MKYITVVKWSLFGGRGFQWFIYILEIVAPTVTNLTFLRWWICAGTLWAKKTFCLKRNSIWHYHARKTTESCHLPVYILEWCQWSPHKLIWKRKLITKTLCPFLHIALWNSGIYDIVRSWTIFFPKIKIICKPSFLTKIIWLGKGLRLIYIILEFWGIKKTRWKWTS